MREPGGEQSAATFAATADADADTCTRAGTAAHAFTAARGDTATGHAAHGGSHRRWRSRSDGLADGPAVAAAGAQAKGRAALASRHARRRDCALRYSEFNIGDDRGRGFAGRTEGEPWIESRDASSRKR